MPLYNSRTDSWFGAPSIGVSTTLAGGGVILTVDKHSIFKECNITPDPTFMAVGPGKYLSYGESSEQIQIAVGPPSIGLPGVTVSTSIENFALKIGSGLEAATLFITTPLRNYYESQ